MKERNVCWANTPRDKLRRKANVYTEIWRGIKRLMRWRILALKGRIEPVGGQRHALVKRRPARVGLFLLGIFGSEGQNQKKIKVSQLNLFIYSVVGPVTALMMMMSSNVVS